jgi:hypothetical protein
MFAFGRRIFCRTWRIWQMQSANVIRTFPLCGLSWSARRLASKRETNTIIGCFMPFCLDFFRRKHVSSTLEFRANEFVVWNVGLVINFDLICFACRFLWMFTQVCCSSYCLCVYYLSLTETWTQTRGRIVAQWLKVGVFVGRHWVDFSLPSDWRRTQI